jgi:dinuclear metal center YbgI/SA1388 family protein
MQCRELIQRIEQQYPTHYALGFDNVGLQVGRLDREIHKVYIALDATGEVIADAIAQGADFLLTHHPLLFSPKKSVTDADFIGRRILELAEHRIAYYAMHTNYDVLRMGEMVADKLGLEGGMVLDVTTKEDSPKGIGHVATLPKTMTLHECCAYVKNKLGITSVQVYGDTTKMVRTMAVCPGSGKDLIDAALLAKADVYVTGDIGHHAGLDAWERGLAVIDAGHYGTEYGFIEDMKQFLMDCADNLEIVTAPVQFPSQVQ